MRKIESEPDFVRATLDWCNERRAEKGLEPLGQLPKGQKSEGRSCPCGKVTRLYVGCEYYWGEDGRETWLPLPVQEFVEAFDSGKLPQYEEGR